MSKESLRKIYIPLVLSVLCSQLAAQTYSTNITATVENAKDQSGTLLTDGSLGMLIVDTTGLGTGLSLVEGSFSVGSFLTNTEFYLAGTASSTSAFGKSVLEWSDIAISGNEFEQGDPVYVAWFPDLTTSDSFLPVSESYGFGRNPDWVLSTSGQDSSFSNALAGSNASSSVNAIPEPSAYATILGLLGLGYAVFCRRRRSSSRE